MEWASHSFAVTRGTLGNRHVAQRALVQSLASLQGLQGWEVPPIHQVLVVPPRAHNVPLHTSLPLPPEDLPAPCQHPGLPVLIQPGLEAVVAAPGREALDREDIQASRAELSPENEADYPTFIPVKTGNHEVPFFTAEPEVGHEVIDRPLVLRHGVGCHPSKQGVLNTGYVRRDRVREQVAVFHNFFLPEEC